MLKQNINIKDVQKKLNVIIARDIIRGQVSIVINKELVCLFDKLRKNLSAANEWTQSRQQSEM